APCSPTAPARPPRPKTRIVRMTRGLALCLAVLLLLSAAASEAQKPRPAGERVDDLARTELRRARIVGLSLAVVSNGVVTKAAGYGNADLSGPVGATPETAFRIGSISKQFIATAIMLLVEENRIKLGDKVATYLPSAPAAWGNITVQHLLTHTSGLV